MATGLRACVFGQHRNIEMGYLYDSDHPTDLSNPTEREEVHNLRIYCNGFVRWYGLFDIEAEMTDHKT